MENTIEKKEPTLEDLQKQIEEKKSNELKKHAEFIQNYCKENNIIQIAKGEFFGNQIVSNICIQFKYK